MRSERSGLPACNYTLDIKVASKPSLYLNESPLNHWWR